MLDATALARLNAKRDRSRLTSTDIAKHLKVKLQAVGPWFQTGQIKMEHLTQLARLLETTIDEILTGNRHNLAEKEMEVLRKYRAETPIQKKQLEEMQDTLDRQNQEVIEQYHSNAYMRQQYRRKPPS